VETEDKNVEPEGARRDAKGDSSITYTPRPDATPEDELAALTAVYRFLLFYRHETSKDVVADGAKEQYEHAE
jgi:hypothetical protein